MSSARKTKLKLKTARPRNPLVAPAARRKAGAHRKSRSAIRRDEKMALKKRLHEAYNERFGPLREKRRAILADEAFVEGVFEEGAARARSVAREVMADARDAAGIAVARGTHG